MIVVDRIEGSIAVLEFAGVLLEISAHLLPDGAAEGSVLVLQIADAQSRLAEAEARLARLRAAGPQDDDIDLS